MVSLLDGRELSFVCSNGKYTTAEELADRTASKLGLSRDSRPLFAIWIVSGSLRMSGRVGGWVQSCVGCSCYMCAFQTFVVERVRADSPPPTLAVC